MLLTPVAIFDLFAAELFLILIFIAYYRQTLDLVDTKLSRRSEFLVDNVAPLSVDKTLILSQNGRLSSVKSSIGGKVKDTLPKRLINST